MTPKITYFEGIFVRGEGAMIQTVDSAPTNLVIFLEIGWCSIARRHHVSREKMVLVLKKLSQMAESLFEVEWFGGYLLQSVTA